MFQVASSLVLKSRKTLFGSPVHLSPKKRPISKKWQENEEKALVEFIALHSDLNTSADGRWPSTHGADYWREAAAYISERNPGCHLRDCMYFIITKKC